MSKRIARAFTLMATLSLLPIASMAEQKVAAVFEEQGVELTKVHAERISNAGVGILEHIKAARVAVSENNHKSAKHHTWEALQMAAKTRMESPTESLRSRLDAATSKLERDGKLSKSDLKPIYQQLDQQSYAREDEIRTYLADVEKGSKKGNTTEIETKLRSAGADVGYLEIDIALDTVVHNLRRAHHLLWQVGGRLNASTADSLLRNAQDQVHVVVAHATYASD